MQEWGKLGGRPKGSGVRVALLYRVATAAVGEVIFTESG